METKRLDAIEIEGVRYVPESQIRQEFNGEIKIVILQRGWCMVGRLERNGDNYKLHNASVIRRWGTSRGLGELAENGPLPETKLDPCNGEVEFDRLTVVATIACNEAKWKSAL